MDGIREPLEGLDQAVGVGPEGVHERQRHRDIVIARVIDRIADDPEHLFVLLVHHVLELARRQRREDIESIGVRLDDRVDIARDSTGDPLDGGVGLGREPSRSVLVPLAGDREAGLDH